MRPVINVCLIYKLKPTKEMLKIFPLNNPQLHVNNSQPETINVNKILSYRVNDRMQPTY